MSEQRVSFPPRPYFHRGGRRAQPFRFSGGRPPAPDRYHERSPSPATNNLSAPPRPAAHVQNHPHRGPVAPVQNHPQRGSPSPVQNHPRRGSPAPRQNHPHRGPVPPVKNHPQRGSPAHVQNHPHKEIVTTSYNCSELLEALKSIQQVAKCCSCHKTLHSVRTCVAGHGVCWNCMNRCSKVCPMCNSLITESKPIMLNNIIKLLPRKCNYNDKGCDGLVLATDMSHETFCRFRDVTCRIPSCEKKCMAKDLLRHLEDFHGQELIRDASHSSMLMNFDARIEKDGLAVIVAFNNIIWQHTRCGKNCLLQFYQYVPMEKPREKFSAQVSFHTPENSFMGSTPVHSDVFDPNRLFNDKETFRLPHKVATAFRQFYGGVNYSFKIIKEDL